MNRPIHIITGTVLAAITAAPATRTEQEGPVTHFDSHNAAVEIMGVKILTNPSNSDTAEFFASPQTGARAASVGVQLGKGMMFGEEIQWVDDGHE